MPIAGVAVTRAADAMLWALGGDQVALILPLPTAPSDPASQLGLSDPGAQQVPISPVVVRNLPTSSSGPSLRLEILLSASAVANAVAEQALPSAEALFDSALGIQLENSLFHIENMTAEYFAGVAYMYRVVAVE
jgi:hypothetical protein